MTLEKLLNGLLVIHYEYVSLIDSSDVPIIADNRLSLDYC